MKFIAPVCVRLCLDFSGIAKEILEKTRIDGNQKQLVEENQVTARGLPQEFVEVIHQGTPEEILW